MQAFCRNRNDFCMEKTDAWEKIIFIWNNELILLFYFMFLLFSGPK